ncbi:MAG TPA: DUF4337 domain-containing protein [Stellaceae bacterium]|nr:DUF4337 domain-containing protein [Stellaceae bacterium]
MVDQTEIPEPVHEHVHHAHHDGQGEGFRRLAAIYVGVVAMLLAISALGGGKATKEMLSANIHASDTYAFAQAKYLRQTANELAADQLEFELNHLPGLSDEGKAKAAERVQHYRGNAARYASDPTTGEGREQLLAKAKEWEAIRDHADAQDPNFEFAAALFQIAIVLGSVSIVAASPALLGLSAVVAGAATALTVNGYFLFVHLPSIG